MLTRLCLPLRGPCAPCEFADRRSQVGRRPRVVHAQLHADDGSVARPRPPGEGDRAGVDEAAAGEEIGDARWNHERPDTNPVYRLPLVVLVAPIAVGGGLLEPL